MSSLYHWLVIALAFACSSLPAIAACPKFEGEVLTQSVWHLPEYQNSGPYDPGDYERKLLGDLTFVDCAGGRHTAKKGVVVNGASIPRGAWTALGYSPWSGRSEKPAIIHDDQCERVVLTSEQVHDLFHQGLRHEGVDYIRAALMYAAVQYFGPQWSEPGGPVTRPTWRDGIWNFIVSAIRGQFGITMFSAPRPDGDQVTVRPLPNALKLDGSANDREAIKDFLRDLKKLDRDFQKFNLSNRITLQDLTAGSSITYKQLLPQHQ